MSHMQVNLLQAEKMVKFILSKKLVPMISGSPGLGKSAMIHAIAKAAGLKVIDLRLSQCDVTDMNGLPSLDKLTNKASYFPMDTFPLDTDVIPAGYKGWILFLDELSSATPNVQAAAYKVIYDRMIGQKPLHPMCYIVGAGNLETDNAVVEPMSTALASRLIHVHVKGDSKSWLDWAMKAGIDSRICDYIGWKKESALYTFTGDTTAVTYACPRTWVFASDLIAGEAELGNDLFLPLLAGTIGEGTAREFISFLKIYTSLPSIDKILANPDTHALPKEDNIRYALLSTLVGIADETNIEAVMTFLGRMPEELQYYGVTSLVSRKGKMVVKTPSFKPWATKLVKFLSED